MTSMHLRVSVSHEAFTGRRFTQLIRINRINYMLNFPINITFSFDYMLKIALSRKTSEF